MPASVEIVAARDKAILGALKFRPRAEHSLLHVLPSEPDQTPEQRRTALESALIRLRVKKLITQTEDGWMLA